MSHQIASGLKHSGGMSAMGLTHSGGAKMPQKLKKFMQQFPDLSEKIAKMAKSKKQSGSGTMSRLLATLGLVGTTAGATALALHQYLLKNPSVTAKILAKGTKMAILGEGLTHSGGSYQVGYGRIGREIIKLTKHTKGTTPAGSLGLAILHSAGHNFKDGQFKRDLMGQKALAHLKKFLKDKPHLRESLANHHVIEFIKKHENTPIHVSDLFGKQWKSKSQKILKLLGETHQEGGNIFKDIGHGFKKGLSTIGSVAKKAVHETGRFLNGETKFKPSKLLSYMSGAVGVLGAASAFIPGIDLISVPTAGAISAGLSGLSTISRTSGRGIGSVKHPELPKYVHWHIKNKPAEMKKILKYLEGKQRGGYDPSMQAGVEPSSWLSDNGMNVLKVLTMAPALITGVKSIMGLFKKKKKSKSSPAPEMKEEIHSSISSDLPPDDWSPQYSAIGEIMNPWKTGGSLYTSGVRKSHKGSRSRISADMRGAGEIGSRAQVWHGTKRMTYKGETREMLTKNKNGRIVLKSRSIAGQKSYQRRKDKSLPFRR